MADGTEQWAKAWEALHTGQPAMAEALCRRALQAESGSPGGWFLLGAACHSQGRAAEASECYAQALRLKSDFPEALLNLGNILSGQGQHGDAEGYFRRALALRPDYPEAHHDLGVALRELGRHDEAEVSFRNTLSLCPDDAEAHNNLGIALGSQGRPTEAAECYAHALRLRPDFPEAHNNLGNALRYLGRPVDAAHCYTQALRLRPNNPQALLNLGNIRRDQGQLDEATECYRRALELRPGYPEAHNNLGIALSDLGRLEEAEKCFVQALALRPRYPEAHNNLGIGQNDLGRPGDAEANFVRALELRPGYPEAQSNLGIALRGQGRLDEAVDCFRRALELRPGYVAALDGLLLTLHYRAEVTPEELITAHAEYQTRYAAPLRATWRPFANDRDPERPLRLGLVSADFGHHSVGFLLIRAVEALAQRPGSVICYSNHRAAPDELQARFKSAASLWRDTVGLSDEGLAELIRADGVDILIDLAGHTTGNRLLTFARRPAPVQATWLGNEGTTGLEAMDYLLADERLVPPDAEAHYRERVLRLPGGYACYDPPAHAPEPGLPPALRTGRVSFGCFNNLAKLSPPVVAAFADVLRRVPGSRLVLKYRGLDDPAVRGRLLERFATIGIQPGQVELRGHSGHVEYLAAYHEVDVALDPFPFGGGVTTCDALWMGVPVVTLPGATFASRHGLSYLAAVGLEELSARNVHEYAVLAAGLARDLDRLASLRAELRQRVSRSPLCDGKRLANELLTALRLAWREWVASDQVGR